jgi:hypothetical protein
MVEVSWPGTTGLQAGSGTVHIWSRSALTFAGTKVTGEVSPCGSMIPPLTKTAIAGGGQVQTVFPDNIWDSTAMPKVQASGSISGFDIGSTISMDPIASAVGLTMGNPGTDPWPAQASAVKGVDHDGDGKKGITGVPRTDAGFTAPPLDLVGALNPNGPRADAVYVATRTVIQLAGKRDTCTTASGTATVSKLDSHVIGCHVKGAAECTQAQSDFVDQNQPKFTVKSATYKMVQVADNATCSDVRAALPP